MTRKLLEANSERIEMIDNKTSRNYPLPHPENIAKQDVVRIRESFVEIDTDINDLEKTIYQLVSNKKKTELEEYLGLWSAK